MSLTSLLTSFPSYKAFRRSFKIAYWFYDSLPIVLQTYNDIISVQNSSQSFSIFYLIQIATHWEVSREFFEHASTSYLIGWIGSRNIDKHMPFRQYAVSNAYSCCPPWPFWSRLSIWIYQPLTESCPETIMIWWNNEQILPFH